jgi:sporulation protein YlmC with PRC-barrel domain
MRNFVLTGVCALGLLAGPAFAQSTATSATSTMSADGNVQFVTQQVNDSWRASKLDGVDVYGADNQKIGSISDILLDSTGQAKVAVIGVGGFLGVGQKDVGVPFSSLKWSNQTEGRTSSANDVSSNSQAAAASTQRGYPASATLGVTKQALQNAPSFQYASASSSSATTSSASSPAGNN